MSDSYLPDNEPRYILSSLEELAAKKLPHAPTFRKAADEITRLRAALAAVTEERDRMREALKPFDDFPLHKWDGIGDDHVLYGPFTLGHFTLGRVRKYLSGSCQAILDNSNYPEKPDSCARAALEGVTEKSGAENE